MNPLKKDDIKLSFCEEHWFLVTPECWRYFTSPIDAMWAASQEEKHHAILLRHTYDGKKYWDQGEKCGMIRGPFNSEDEALEDAQVVLCGMPRRRAAIEHTRRKHAKK